MYPSITVLLSVVKLNYLNILLKHLFWLNGNILVELQYKMLGY